MVSLAIAVLILPGVLGAAIATVTSAAGAFPDARVPPPPTYKTVNYNSSVDRFPLSYEIYLPAGFSATKSYPLSVYLHGLMGTINATHRGGYLADLPGSTWGNKIAAAASLAGYILVTPNTRMVDGFYFNSKYTGPQEQDILDAIADVRSHQHISGLYLFGQSMGSIGTYSIGLNHPGMFKGLGIINDCGDVYAASYWRILQQVPSMGVIKLVTGGSFPNQSAYAQGVYYHLSASRYYPANLSGVRLYEVNGGADTLCPVVASIWSQYQQGNNTLVTSTCSTITQFQQPASCTTPVRTLAALYPSLYQYRYDYVAKGGHAPAILNPTDLYAYWSGKVPGGLVCGASGGPPTTCR